MKNFKFSLAFIKDFFSRTYSLVRIPRSNNCYMYFNTEFRQLARSHDGSYLVTVDDGFVKRKTLN